jgi:RNA polymerase sigma-70 factor (ECF subfamily)
MRETDFLDIYDRYYTPIRKFILTIVRDEWSADDLIQETFVKVRKNIDSLKDPAKMSTWLHRVAYNLCQDHFRRTRSGSRHEARFREQGKNLQDALLPMAMEQRQMGECVQDRMSLLPESLSSVLILYDVLGFSQKEIADILEIRVDNVKVRLHRARKKMKTILEEHCTFERDDRNVLVCLPK